MTPLAIGFLPLTDSAVLVAAREKGFAEAEAIDLTLLRTTSWATLRDRLVYGQVQGAHMLAPLAIAVTLGLSQLPAAIAAPFKLNVNGNALVMAADFAAALDPDPARRVADPLAAAQDFAGAVGLHRRKPIIGIVHRFSSHAMMLRYWLASAGLDPDRDVVLRVLPPSLMVEAMRAGEIDGFTAGAPWGSVAVQEGLAEIVAIGSHIWRRGVEKVLAFRADWMEGNPEIVDRLLVALSRASAWCDDPANREELAGLLARPDYVGQPEAVILPALTGRMPLRGGGPSIELEDMILFHREAAAFPWRSQALWIYSQFVRWGLVKPNPEMERRAGDVFRPDIYRRALSGMGQPIPGANMKVEGSLSAPRGVGSTHRLILGPDRFFDGRIFDPQHIEDYVAGFDAH